MTKEISAEIQRKENYKTLLGTILGVLLGVAGALGVSPKVPEVEDLRNKVSELQVELETRKGTYKECTKQVIELQERFNDLLRFEDSSQ